MKPIQVRHDYAGSAISAIEEVLSYARACSLYEMQEKINAAKVEMRRRLLECDASEMSAMTLQLAKAKLKLDILRQRIAACPESCQELLNGLCDEVEQHIAGLRNGRNDIAGRRY